MIFAYLKGKLFIWLKDGRNKLSIVKVRGSVDYSYWKSCMKKLNEETEKTAKEEARPKEQSQRSEVVLSSQYIWILQVHTIQDKSSI